eukprot:CAMPEP_0195655642 /NCGR_PEP_ID=MMETSP0815-20121206/34570_1 /TAXON_ID=97485 /ORGANISM="Prymnesium parvum, Strain Texoma1" /LENGTH=312 /DNA_ID=CAMNT_0040799949 /DNA_START=77 /DNA_END=1011 /DNA_ORIENTATION=+
MAPPRGGRRNWQRGAPPRGHARAARREEVQRLRQLGLQDWRGAAVASLRLPSGGGEAATRGDDGEARRAEYREWPLERGGEEKSEGEGRRAVARVPILPRLVVPQVSPAEEKAVPREEKLVGRSGVSDQQREDTPREAEGRRVSAGEGESGGGGGRGVGRDGDERGLHRLLLQRDGERGEHPSDAPQPREEEVLLAEDDVQHDHRRPRRARQQQIGEQHEPRELRVPPRALQPLAGVQEHGDGEEHVGRRRLEVRRGEHLPRPRDRVAGDEREVGDDGVGQEPQREVRGDERRAQARGEGRRPRGQLHRRAS